LRQKHSHQ